MKILNLVRERKAENWSVTDSFWVEDFVENPEEALRNAVKDFMISEDGKDGIIYACGDYNWGDAISGITDEFLIPHGLRWYNEDVITVIVNQDELLYPDIQNKILNVEE